MEHSTALRGLAYAQLCRPDWFTGHIASVTRVGTHRLLTLRETSRDGSLLTVWLSSVAIDAHSSAGWAGLLDVQPMPALSVRLRGRFVAQNDSGALTADIHFPENIGVSRCDARQAAEVVACSGRR